MKTKIWENQNTLVFEGDVSKEDAIILAKTYHNKEPNKYHEIYCFEPDLNKYIGVAQWKPGDCEHQRPKDKCPYCNPQSLR